VEGRRPRPSDLEHDLDPEHDPEPESDRDRDLDGAVASEVQELAVRLRRMLGALLR
jgi:hypothetical protein